MRSDKINPLFSSISTLTGIGPKLDKLFNRLVGTKLIHFLWHLPYNVIKRKKYENINDAQINTLITCKVKILKHSPSKFKRQPYKVHCICKKTPIDIIFFNARHPVIRSSLPINEQRIISGKLEYFKNNFQILHPAYIIKIHEIKNIKEFEPIYGLTAGLSQKIFTKNMQKVLNIIPNLDEWIADFIIEKYLFQSWKKSLLSIHNPISTNDLLHTNKNRRT